MRKTEHYISFFQRGQIFVIDKVLAGIKPELFILKNLQNVALKPKFYKEQLRLAPDPTEVPFEIEKILDERTTRKNGKELLVCTNHFFTSMFFKIINIF